jgi:Zn-dependent protease
VNSVEQILVMAVPLVLAITLHEAAHAYVADMKGDNTARLLGRISLNPIVHIDLFGTILIPFLMFMTTGFIFGYAKPVPVNAYQLRRPRQDMAWVAAAGPGMNLALAIVSGLLYRSIDRGILSSQEPGTFQVMLLGMFHFSVMINLWLMAFNLIPIPPLDGGRVLMGLLPEASSRQVHRMEPYGMAIITLLVFLDPFGLIPRIIMPIVQTASVIIFNG